jgi:hypothetical protein
MEITIHWWHIGCAMIVLGIILMLCGKVDSGFCWVEPDLTSVIGMLFLVSGILFLIFGAIARAL